MSAKEHYQNHLGHFYSWMLGDFTDRMHEQKSFFQKHRIQPYASGLAIDLGAGNGIQTIALAELGFTVKAVDYNARLLHELQQQAKQLTVECTRSEILAYLDTLTGAPELVICMGDTLTHFNVQEEVEQLFLKSSRRLQKTGRLVISYRDLTSELADTKRFIPVKSDDNRILTCFLEYFPGKVRVTDLLQEKENGQWVQKISSYFKLRLSPEWIISCARSNNLELTASENNKGMHYFVFTKH